MQDASKQKVLYQYQRSFPIQSQELPSFKYGLQRTALYNITLFRMDGNDQVLLQSMACVDTGRNVPTWMINRLITDTLQGTKSMVQLVDSRAIADAGMMKTASAPRTESSKACMGGCLKKFSLLRHRVHCRSCGHGVCKSCIISLKFFNEQSQYTTCLPIMTERFCRTCVQNARARHAVDRLAATFVKTSTHHHEPSMKQRVLRGKISTSLLEPANTSISRSSTLTSSMSSGMGSTCSPSTVGLNAEERHWIPETMSQSYSSRSSRSSTQQSPLTSGSSRETMFKQMNASIRQQEELLMTMQKERARMHYQQQQYQLHQSSSMPFYANGLSLSELTSDMRKSPSISDEDRFEILS